MTLRPFAALLVLAAAPVLAQQQRTRPAEIPPRQAETAAFVVTIGTDTLAVERYTRTADSIQGEMVSRTPRTVTRSYTAWLNPDGSVRRMSMTSRVPGTPQPPTVATATFTADSVFTRVQRGDSVYNFRVGGHRAFPLVNYSHVFYEQAMMHARAGRADSTLLSLVPIGANQAYPMVVHAGADSMRLVNLAGTQRVATDARGRLLGLNGLESTQKFIVTRLRDVDVDAYAAEFARRDATRQGLGTLSPRDSAVADLGGAHVAIDYGRPFKRGRQVFGGIVPWGEVWRTGANAATGITTTRPLVIGGAPVPAGSYTLWSLPAENGAWKLIVNRQTGQWGTEYHAEQDLVRVDLQTRKLAAPVEEFTIRLEPRGTGGVLRLQWDDTEAFVPVTVR